MATESTSLRLRVWDLPLRLFHWALVVLIGFAWWSVETHHLDWHKTAGSLIAGLLVFRLWWGILGGSTARFSDFVRGPGTLWRYLFSKQKPDISTGHNPLGALSVIALLVLCLAVICFGLFAVDTDGLESGPLSDLVDFDQGRLASKLHGLAFEGLQILVVLHLAAIAFYALVKKQPLVRAMITGRKTKTGEAGDLVPAKALSLITGLVLGAATSAILIYMSK